MEYFSINPENSASRFSLTFPLLMQPFQADLTPKNVTLALEIQSERNVGFSHRKGITIRIVCLNR